MKITFDISERTACMFVNYIAYDKLGGMIMGVRQVSTEDLLRAKETGEPIIVPPYDAQPKVPEVPTEVKENNENG